MTVLDILSPDIVKYRRREKSKHFYYAKYPNGDFFEGSGNGTPVFFKTRKGLLDNILWHARNIWHSELQNELEGINSEEELFNEIIKHIEIIEL